MGNTGNRNGEEASKGPRAAAVALANATAEVRFASPEIWLDFGFPFWTISALPILD